MKRIFITALALCLVFGLVTAEAGQKNKVNRKAPAKGKRTEKTEEMKVPQFVDKYPPMVFHAGVLNQEGLGGWRVGDMDLWLKKDCVIMADGQSGGFLRDGSKAIVMGSKTGNTIVAWSIRVMKPDGAPEKSWDSNVQKEPLDNPNLSVLRSPVD